MSNTERSTRTHNAPQCPTPFSGEERNIFCQQLERTPASLARELYDQEGLSWTSYTMEGFEPIVAEVAEALYHEAWEAAEDVNRELAHQLAELCLIKSTTLPQAMDFGFSPAAVQGLAGAYLTVEAKLSAWIGRQLYIDRALLKRVADYYHTHTSIHPDED